MTSKMPQNFYETLDVSKSASQDDIKRSYRKKSRKAHPDKGGTQTEQAVLNQAYECLSDPVRRLEYDNTGQDRPANATETEARNIILTAFDQLIVQKVESDCIRHIENSLKHGRDGCDAKRSEVAKMIKTLEHRRDKIKRKKKPSDDDGNLFRAVVDQKLGLLRAGVAQITQQIESLTMALKMLEEYESLDETKSDFRIILSNSMTEASVKSP